MAQKVAEEGVSRERIAALTRVCGFALVHAWTYIAFFSRLVHYSDRNSITHLNSMYALATCGITVTLLAVGVVWFVVRLDRGRSGGPVEAGRPDGAGVSGGPSGGCGLAAGDGAGVASGTGAASGAGAAGGAGGAGVTSGGRERAVRALGRFVDGAPLWFAPCAAAGLSVCTVALVMVENRVFTQPWCSIASFLSGVSVAAFFLAWIPFFTRGSDRSGLIHLVASITLAAVLFVGVLYLPKEVGIALTVAGPLISLACHSHLCRSELNRAESGRIAAGEREVGKGDPGSKAPVLGGRALTLGDKASSAGAPGMSVSGTSAPGKTGPASRKACPGVPYTFLDMGLLKRITECLFLLGLAEGLCRAVFAVINPIADTVAYRWIFLLGAVISAAVVVASGIERPGRRPAHDVSRVSMTLLGLLILLIPIVHDFSLVSDCMVFVCHSLIYLLAWVVLTRAVDAYRVDVFAVFGVGLGGMFAGLLIGTFGGSLLTSFCELGYRAESLVALVCAGMVFAAFLFIADERVFITFTGGDEERPVAPRRFGLRIREIAESHGLTAKETEILVLISKGRTSQRIQEMLGISTGTMNTHMVHIYKKLGIHDRQQLLDMLEETE